MDLLLMLNLPAHTGRRKLYIFLIYSFYALLTIMSYDGTQVEIE